MLRLILATVALAAASAQAEPSTPELRDAARLVLEEHCGTCHIRHYPTAMAGALAIYDLSETEWAATMQPSQLAGLVDRLEGQGVTELAAIRAYVARVAQLSAAPPTAAPP